MRITKIMNILEFHARIMKIMKIMEFHVRSNNNMKIQELHARIINHENHRIPYENQTKYEIYEIP